MRRGAVFAAATDQSASLRRYLRRGFPGCKCSAPHGPCAGGVITGEASPSYLADARVPAQLERHLPGVKILVVLREPVARCLSSYRHNYLSSLPPGQPPIPFETLARWECERVLEPCLAAHAASGGGRIDLAQCYREVSVEEQFREAHELGGRWSRGSVPQAQRSVWRSMVGRSLFWAQLDSWASFRERGELHVVWTEQLDAAAMQGVAEFLGLPRHAFDCGLRFNTSARPGYESALEQPTAAARQPPQEGPGWLRRFFAPHNARLAGQLLAGGSGAAPSWASGE